MNGAYETFLRELAADWEHAGNPDVKGFLEFASKAEATKSGLTEPRVYDYAKADGQYIVDMVNRDRFDESYDLDRVGQDLDKVLSRTAENLWQAMDDNGICYEEELEAALNDYGYDPDELSGWPDVNDLAEEKVEEAACVNEGRVDASAERDGR